MASESGSRHEQTVGHPLLKVLEHGRLAARDRNRQRLARGRPELNNVSAISLRAEDHDSIFASLRHRHFFLPQSSSTSRVTAAALGFFILSQSGERPER